MMQENAKARDRKNQGEGNRDADKRYREDAKDFVRSHDTDELGDKARTALEGDQGENLKKAEKAGRKKAKAFDPQVKRD
jgi:hypothetical protein